MAAVTSQNKVRFGVSNLTFWSITADGTSLANPTYGTKYSVPGTVQIEVEYDGTETKFYADNQLYFAGTRSSGNSGSFENALLPDALKAAAYGWRVDSNGGLVETDDATPGRFAMAYQIDGDEDSVRVIHYDVTLGYPKESHTTTEDGITVNTETINWTGKRQNLSGESVSRYSLAEGGTGYADWFGSTPVFPAAKTH